MSIPDEICAYADKRLEGSTLAFALVIWVKGSPDDPKAVALSTPPHLQQEAATALLTTAVAARRQVAGLDPMAVTPVASMANLRTAQRQLDADGCEVGVSRQALDEVLDFIDPRT